MNPRCAPFAVTLALLLTSGASADNGFVGAYADSQGTLSCTTVPQYSGTLLHLVATTAGLSDSGIVGAEFRIEVSNPEGWSLAYIPPPGAITIGSLIDTDPTSDADGSGLDIAFPSCHEPSQGGTVGLGTIYAYNAGGDPTTLLVKRHTTPSNALFQCPAFVLCDAPYYSMVCMSPGAAEACSLSSSKPFVIQSAGDPTVFAMGLNAQLDGPPVPPEERPRKPIDVVGVPTLVTTLETPDVVDEWGAVQPPVSKVLQDTTWIADWGFDGGNPCQTAGWTYYDNRDLNDGEVYWTTENRDYLAGIDGHAAVLRSFRSCWADTGYGNDWDQSLRLNYQGVQATLSFDFVLDTPFEDGMTIEADIGCASQDSINPELRPSQLRIPVPDGAWWRGGAFLAEHVSFSLPEAESSCVYIRFTSDRDYSDEDGLFHSSIGAGLIVDNIVMTGDIAYSENFESQTWNPNVVPVNSAPSISYGEWARAYRHVTDNHPCPDNTTCSWLFTDPSRTAFFPDMAFGPGYAVIRNWLDNILVSPWVSLQSAPSLNTTLTFHEFPGNRFSQGRIMRSYSVRGKTSSGCVSPWSNDSDEDFGTWQDLSTFRWVTRSHDISHFVDQAWDSLQVRFRVADWQYVFGDGPPASLNPGPGPYIDRVRLGRRVSSGPSISEGEDSRSQAQDAFPDSPVFNAIHGTVSFRASLDLAPSSVIAPGESIWVSIADQHDAGGIDQVRFYGVIVAGPHVGKSPPPYTVAGDSMFFHVTPDSCRRPSGAVVPGNFFVDLDDTYFRGGDVLRYFWLARDGSGEWSSNPSGITFEPQADLDLATAEQHTGGLLEVSYLPTIDWDQGYLNRIQADPQGKLEPTQQEKDNSLPSNCILYVNKVNLRRLSTQRTSFMYTLDKLGYRGDYDVYDLQGFGNTNNDLGTRAHVLQASWYNLIVHDAGQMRDGAIPDGSDPFTGTLDQAQWYADWLSLGRDFLVDAPTLWILGENVLTYTQSDVLIEDRLGVDRGNLVADAAPTSNPTVNFAQGFRFFGQAQPTTFNPFILTSTCPERKDYDSGELLGTAEATHRFSGTDAHPAVIMRADSLQDVFQVWHPFQTIMMPFSWMDVANAPNTAYYGGDARMDLAYKILAHGLPLNCVESQNPVDVISAGNVPSKTALHQNAPNPFNPSTVIRFDLAEECETTLRIYDLAGRLVRNLVTEKLPAGRRSVIWDGSDNRGNRVASGVYFYQLQAGDVRATRKLVVVK